MKIDHDLILALHDERPRTIRALILRRARRDWARRRLRGAPPESITDKATGRTHWLLDGLTHVGELAACGQDITAFAWQDQDKTIRDGSRPINCPRCLALLARLRASEAADEPAVLPAPAPAAEVPTARRGREWL